MTTESIFSKRSTKYGANMLIMILIVLGIVVLIGAISIRHHWMFDLTKTRRHSLSDETIKVLKSVNKEVDVIAFYQENSGSQGEYEDLLKLYKYKNPKFSYRFIDPDRNPTLARKHEIADYGTAVFTCGDNKTRVSWAREEKVTNAILKVIREEKKVIYFLKGHGENDVSKFTKDGYSQAKKALEGQNYEVKELVLLRAKDIPKDASAIVISGPKKKLFKSEMNLINGFIKKGGNLLVLIDPFTVPGVTDFLEEYNLRFRNDIIIDKMSQLFGGDYLMPVVTQYEHHSITRNFSITTFFPFARSIEIDKKARGRITIEPLARTNEASWGETDRKRMDKGEAAFDEGEDTQGPLTIAAVLTMDVERKKGRKVEKGKSRIVVFGDSDFANNSYINILGNRDLFLNTLNWLAEEEDLISIRPKDTDYNPIVLSKTMGKVIFFIPVIIIPVMILAIGIAVLSFRRWRR